MAKRTPISGPPFSEVLEDFNRRVFDEGEKVFCPCCGYPGVVYTITFDCAKGRSLYKLDWLGGYVGNWVRISALSDGEKQKLNSWNYAKMRFWKVIEKPPGWRKKDGNVWRVTDKGRAFLRGGLLLWRHVYVYHNELHSVSRERTSIQLAMGTEFDEYRLKYGYPEKF